MLFDRLFLHLQFTLVLKGVYTAGVCYNEILPAFPSTKHETTVFSRGPHTYHAYSYIYIYKFHANHHYLQTKFDPAMVERAMGEK